MSGYYYDSNDESDDYEEEDDYDSSDEDENQNDNEYALSRAKAAVGLLGFCLICESIRKGGIKGYIKAIFILIAFILISFFFW